MSADLCTDWLRTKRGLAFEAQVLDFKGGGVDLGMGFEVELFSVVASPPATVDHQWRRNHHSLFLRNGIAVDKLARDARHKGVCRIDLKNYVEQRRTIIMDLELLILQCLESTFYLRS